MGIHVVRSPMSASCILYHGPGAKGSAIAEANRIGRLISPPLGDGGLKVDEAREVVSLLSSTPTGEAIGVIVLGPMDEANPKASDTLLKTIEEAPSEYTALVMWANDLGGVSSTVKSRCLEKWSDSIGNHDDDPITIASMRIVDAVLSNDILSMINTARPFDKREYELISAISNIMSSKLDIIGIRSAWSRIRVVAARRNPMMSEIIIALSGN